jgi:hypothetical protein
MRALTVTSAAGAGAAASPSPKASSRRCSGERSSNSRKTWRSFARSGSCAASATGSISTGTSVLIVASTFDRRALSACVVRFSLRLAPEMSSMWPRTSSSVPKRCSSSEAVLSPIPGTPGMLSDVSPFRP